MKSFISKYLSRLAPVVLVLSFVLLPHVTHAATGFVTTWKTTTPSESINIPTFSGDTYNYTVDWGDATTPDTWTGDATHTYVNANTYTVTITGTFPRIYFNSNGSSASKIFSVEQWGSNQWDSMNHAFDGCSNLAINATDSPDLSNVTDMTEMFAYDTTLNSASLNNWDVSHVTNMYGLFYKASSFNQPLANWNLHNVTDTELMFSDDPAFNQPIGNWDVSGVTNMENMFYRDTAFNQSIGNWDVSNVTDMHGMFESATAFNQPLDSWGSKMSHVTTTAQMFEFASSFNQPLNSWVLSSDTSMNGMFGTASSFNQPLNNWDVSHVLDMTQLFVASSFNQDIHSWNVSNVANMSEMFRATPFNQNIGNWNVANVQSMTHMFTDTGLSTTNYDAILAGWSTESLHSNVTLDATGTSYYGGGPVPGIYYCTSGTQRSSIITTSHWTINDAGLGCPNTFTYIAGANGTVRPPLQSSQIIQKLDYGVPNTSSVTASANTGYHFVNWSDNSTQNPRSDANGHQDLTVTANFAITVVKPSLINDSATSITQTSVTLNGEITNTGGENPNQRYFGYLLSSDYQGQNTNINNVHQTIPENGSFGVGPFSASVTGLTCGTNYMYSAIAQNSAGVQLAGAPFGTFTTASCSGGGGGGGVAIILGCKDPSAVNYNPNLGISPQNNLCIYTGTYTTGLPALNQPESNTASTSSSTTTNGPKTHTLTGCAPGVQFSAFTGHACPISSSEPFLHNLWLGNNKNDVIRLQHFLNTHGFPITTTGWGSLNHESIHFGVATFNALKLYQASVGIRPTGDFGPITRTYVNNLLAEGK